MALQKRIRCMVMRAGTSKGVYLLENDLPQDPAEREQVILKIFGSPDPRQIDGLGGADPLTSKVAIIGPPSVEGADVDYTFGQVEIHEAKVHFNGNCGNISAGVGPFAILMGLVKAREPVTTVRVYNTNSRKILVEEVPMEDGEPAVYGDFAIPGVPGAGAEIRIDFSQTVGSVTGKLLPTGNPVDEVEVPGYGVEVRVDGIPIRVGTRELMSIGHVGIPDSDLFVDEGSSCLYIAITDEYAGCIVFTDPVREDAAEGAEEIRSCVDNVVMFSADSRDRTPQHEERQNDIEQRFFAHSANFFAKIQKIPTFAPG